MTQQLTTTMPAGVALWARATGRKFIAAQARGRMWYYMLDEKGQVAGDVPAYPGPQWRSDVMDGLNLQGYQVKFSGDAVTLSHAKTGKVFWEEGETNDAALLAAGVTMMESEGEK